MYTEGEEGAESRGNGEKLIKVDLLAVIRISPLKIECCVLFL